MKSVLVVEDDKLLLSAIQFMLRNEGYKVCIAMNGVEALRIIEKEEIDLIISDILMPNISGYDLLSMLRRFYYFNVPFLVISSLSKESIEPIASKLGVSGIMTKPIDFKSLLHEVKRIIKK